LPAWENGHATIEPILAGANADRLRADLRSLA
jgi:hypothetical protein